MIQDHYTLLGIPREAGEEEIKRAYYRLAREWHPDRNLGNTAQATQRFKEIGQAYEVLSDKQKRLDYDRSSESWGRHHPHAPSKSEHAAEQRGDDVRLLELSLEDLYKGARKSVVVVRTTRTGTSGVQYLQLDVQPGWKSGTRIRFPRMGNQRENGERQDVVFVVQEKRHRAFRREGDDLVITVQIADLATAQNEQIFVRSLDGRLIQLQIPYRPRGSHFTSRLLGEGMPSRKHAGGKGDLMVNWALVHEDGGTFWDQDLFVDVRVLPVTLEEWYAGTTKTVSWTRRLLSGKTESETVHIDVPQGAQSGRRTRFVGAGDEQKYGRPFDVVFVLKEAPHPVFRREGDKLHANMTVDLQYKNHKMLVLALLDGSCLDVNIPKGRKRDQETRIEGAGMTTAVPGRKGDLVVHWRMIPSSRRTRNVPTDAVPGYGREQASDTSDTNTSFRNQTGRATTPVGGSMRTDKVDVGGHLDLYEPFIGEPVDWDHAIPTRSPSELAAWRPAHKCPKSTAMPNEYRVPLKLTLEELYLGTVKKIETVRKLASGDAQQRIFEIEVLPGWKTGTEVRFPRAGNEYTSEKAPDIVFIVEELPHAWFSRDGDDLFTTIRMPGEIARGYTKLRPHRMRQLDGRIVPVPLPIVDGVIDFTRKSRVIGGGMPIDEGRGKRTGDMIVTWEVSADE